MGEIAISGKVVEIGNLENTDGAVGLLIETDSGKHVGVIGLIPEQLDGRMYGKRVTVSVVYDC